MMVSAVGAIDYRRHSKRNFDTKTIRMMVQSITGGIRNDANGAIINWGRLPMMAIYTIVEQMRGRCVWALVGPCAGEVYRQPSAGD